MPVLKRRVQALKGSPELCKTCGVLQEGSAERFTEQKPVEEKFSGTPKGSAEPHGCKPRRRRDLLQEGLL